ncbi:TPA: site-specific DNA-methyltransferase [Bacillus cereus]|nr:site-specific DNA-methyltransferase [Bacillus cereus]
MVNKMNGESIEITKQNIERLKELFPEVLTDGEKIDFDMLRTVLGEVVEDNNERYQFTWHGKKQTILGAQKPSKGTLRPVPEKSKNFDTTENLYIEWDNLEVLKLLQKSYNGKIKMIYIDPPYNTGNDFVYKDDFKSSIIHYLRETGQIDVEGNSTSTNTEANGRYHSDWLNMMYPRIKLARNLLMDNGLIFISIDENEMENLKKICNEIFGERNLVQEIVWRNKYGAGAKTKGFIGVHEYILCYSKTPILNIEAPLNEDQISEYNKNKDEHYSMRGGYVTQPLMTRSLDDRANLQYTIEYNGETIVPRKQWVWEKSRLLEAIKNNEVVFNKKNDGTYSVRAKKYLKNIDGTMRKGKPLSLLNGPFTQQGTKEIEETLGSNKIFNFPKPSELIKYLFSFTVNEVEEKDGIYLDFFSGSATAAQAIMKLNSEDQGQRKFILAQLPEVLEENSEAYKEGYLTICDIGEERIRRAGEKIKQELVEKQKAAGMLDENTVDPESLDIGFKVLKLDTSNIREWNADFENIEEQMEYHENPLIEGRTELDIVYEIMLKHGLELTYPIETFEVDGKTIYDIAFGNLFICLADHINTNIAKAIIAKRDEYGIETSSVVFSDAGFEGNDSEKLNCIELLKGAGYPEDNLLTI